MSMSIRFLSVIISCFFFIGVISGCGNSSKPTNSGQPAPAATKTRALKFGHVNGDTHPINKAGLLMAEIIKTKTNGRYTIDVLANSALGGERDLIEGVQMGSIDLCYTAGTPLGNYVPEMLVTDLPFLIRNLAHADAVYHGEIGKKLLSEVEKKGFKSLAFVEIGFRNMALVSKPINTVADIKGIKIRTMENKLHLEAWTRLGAKPLPMAWGEAFTALQQGAIDAVEMTNTHMVSNGVIDVMKYYAETNHVYTPGLILMSQSFWKSLSAEDQKIFADAALEAGKLNDKLIREQDSVNKAKIAAKGVKMNTLDQAALKAAVQGVYTNHPEFQELVAKIQDAK